MVLVYSNVDHGGKPISVLFITGRTYQILRSKSLKQISDVTRLKHEELSSLCQDNDMVSEIVQALDRYDLAMGMEEINEPQLDENLESGGGDISEEDLNTSKRLVETQIIEEKPIQSISKEHAESQAEKLPTQNVSKRQPQTILPEEDDEDSSDLSEFDDPMAETIPASVLDVEIDRSTNFKESQEVLWSHSSLVNLREEMSAELVKLQSGSPDALLEVEVQETFKAT